MTIDLGELTRPLTELEKARLTEAAGRALNEDGMMLLRRLMWQTGPAQAFCFVVLCAGGEVHQMNKDQPQYRLLITDRRWAGLVKRGLDLPANGHKCGPHTVRPLAMMGMEV